MKSWSITVAAKNILVQGRGVGLPRSRSGSILISSLFLTKQPPHSLVYLPMHRLYIIPTLRCIPPLWRVVGINDIWEQFICVTADMLKYTNGYKWCKYVLLLVFSICTEYKQNSYVQYLCDKVFMAILSKIRRNKSADTVSRCWINFLPVFGKNRSRYLLHVES